MIDDLRALIMVSGTIEVAAVLFVILYNRLKRPTSAPSVTPAPSKPAPATVDTLRPARLADIIGQRAIKDALGVSIRAARARRQTLDHCLFYGPPGTGKTTFASVIASEMGHRLKRYVGPEVTPQVVREIIADLIASTPTVVFVDEIHKMKRDAMTLFLPLAEDFAVGAVTVPPFTLIGATTDPESVIAPLRRRFQQQFEVRYYSPAETAEIIMRSYRVLTHAPIDEPALLAIHELAKRARGIPSDANRLLRRTVDYLIVPTQNGYSYKPLTVGAVNGAMLALDIDIDGLSYKERQMLVTIHTQFNDGPAGIAAIAAAMGENPEALEAVMEPILVRQGFLNRLPRGRILTDRGIAKALRQLP